MTTLSEEAPLDPDVIEHRSRKHDYGLLLAAAIASLFVQGTVSPTHAQQVAVTALSAATLLLAFRVANFPARVQRIALALAVLAVGVSVVRSTGGVIGEGPARLTNAALVALGPPAVAIGVLRDLRTTGRVRIESVMGVLSLYMLIGMLFGFVYGAIDHLGGAPFFAGGDTATVAHSVYFSFVTLSTVGYGDFVARSNLGHTLSVFEALLGQIYLVTVVSVLVSNIGRPAGGGRLRDRQP